MSTRWDAVARKVLAGEAIDPATALSVLRSPDDELLAVLAAAFEVRRAFFWRQVQL